MGVPTQPSSGRARLPKSGAGPVLGGAHDLARPAERRIPEPDRGVAMDAFGGYTHAATSTVPDGVTAVGPVPRRRPRRHEAGSVSPAHPAAHVRAPGPEGRSALRRPLHRPYPTGTAQRPATPTSRVDVGRRAAPAVRGHAVGPRCTAATSPTRSMHSKTGSQLTSFSTKSRRQIHYRIARRKTFVSNLTSFGVFCSEFHRR